MNRAQAKQAAKQQIKGKIGILFMISLIIFIISLVAGTVLAFIPLIGPVASMIIISPAFTLSVARVYLNLVAGNGDITVSDTFTGFNDFWSAFKVGLLTGLLTFLGLLLFIIPGIIMSLSYSMSMYVLAENRGMSALECLKRSKKMTDGHKMELLVLALSFIGWIVLTIVTFGLAAVYVVPYTSATFVNYYEGLKRSVPELSTAGTSDSDM